MKTYVALLIMVSSSLIAQTESSVRDGNYDKENNPGRRMIPYAHLRGADVMWSKKVWRVMDLREKMNLSLYYPIYETRDRRSMF